MRAERTPMRVPLSEPSAAVPIIPIPPTTPSSCASDKGGIERRRAEIRWTVEGDQSSTADLDTVGDSGLVTQLRRQRVEAGPRPRNQPRAECRVVRRIGPRPPRTARAVVERSRHVPWQSFMLVDPVGAVDDVGDRGGPVRQRGGIDRLDVRPAGPWRALRGRRSAGRSPATLCARTPPPAITTSASPARATRPAMVAAPFAAVSAPPDVSTRSTPRASSASSASIGSRLASIALWHVTGNGLATSINRRMIAASIVASRRRRRTRRRWRRQRPPHGCHPPSPTPRWRRRRSPPPRGRIITNTGIASAAAHRRSARCLAWSRPRRGARTARPVPRPRRPTRARHRANRCRTRRGTARRAQRWFPRAVERRDVGTRPRTGNSSSTVSSWRIVSGR